MHVNLTKIGNIFCFHAKIRKIYIRLLSNLNVINSIVPFNGFYIYFSTRFHINLSNSLKTLSYPDLQKCSTFDSIIYACNFSLQRCACLSFTVKVTVLGQKLKMNGNQ